MINAEDYMKKKDKKREYTRYRYQNMSEEGKQKLSEHKKSRICGISQKELQRQVEQLIENIK